MYLMTVYPQVLLTTVDDPQRRFGGRLLSCSIPSKFLIEADWNQLAPLTPLRHQLGELLPHFAEDPEHVCRKFVEALEV
jgi:hypothetical protein